MALRASDVFVPGAYPEHTYVERSDDVEQRLQDALETSGMIASLVGPSKSGKTVLVEKVVGQDFLISIPGGAVASADDMWQRIADRLDLPISTTEGQERGATYTGEVEAKAEAGVPLVTKFEGGLKGSASASRASSNEATRVGRALPQVFKTLQERRRVVLIDDFHYMDRRVQVEVAQSLKDAIREGVTIVIASVQHRGDDVIRANTDLRGRVTSLDLEYWSLDQLLEIARRGFRALRYMMPADLLEKFAQESAGSPQLMQSLCLQACFEFGLREEAVEPTPVDIHPDRWRGVFERTAATTNCRSLVEVLRAGAATRGTPRTTFHFRDGTKGDVYTAVLKAVAADPPRLAFPYAELLERTKRICDGEFPTGSSVSGACVQMASLALQRLNDERSLDWDEQTQVLDIPDPYLMFYLRWSGHLNLIREG